MELKRIHWMGIILGLIIIAAGIIAYATGDRASLLNRAAFLVIGIGVFIGLAPFVVSAVTEAKEEKEKEEMFIEFSRALVESVKSGTPIVNSILNIQNKPFGTLSPHIKKLANQIALGIPLTKALEIFARDVDNATISRAVALIGEAEKAGGEIGTVLESVAISVAEIDKLKKERRAAIYNLVVQGYIIFFVFIAIVLIMQFRIFPQLQGIGSIQAIGAVPGELGQGALSPQDVSGAFFVLLIVQGFFTGLFVGKLTEGSLKAGIKHSFILVLVAFLFWGGAQIFLAAPPAT